MFLFSGAGQAPLETLSSLSEESQPDDLSLPPRWKRNGPPPQSEFVKYNLFRFRSVCLTIAESPLFEKISMAIIIINTIDMCLVWYVLAASHCMLNLLPSALAR